MKALFIISFIFLSININFAQQVGIYTERPFGVLHIDGKGDNTTNEIPAELLNDVIVQSDGLGGVNVGLGGIPFMSNQLDLLDPNRAMLINRVALQSDTDIVTVPNPQKGMLVYNTQISGSNIIPGFYTYNGNNWDYLEVDFNNGFTLLGLRRNTSSVISNGSTTVGGGSPLALGDADENENYTLTLAETGSYAFEFRLNGTVEYRPAQSTVYYYLGVFKNDVLQDLAEMDIQTGGLTNDGSTTEDLSYTITMGCQAVAGDKITFKLSHYTSTNQSWTLTGADTNNSLGQTTMIYCKL